MVVEITRYGGLGSPLSYPSFSNSHGHSAFGDIYIGICRGMFALLPTIFQPLFRPVLLFSTALPLIFKTVLENVHGECVKRPRENPAATPFAECGPVFLTSPQADPDRLLRGSSLIRRVKNAIEYIEEGSYGRIDTYGRGGLCDTYHFHVLVPMERHQNIRRMINGGSTLKEIASTLVEEADPDVVFLYHTAELNGRFEPYSANRNILQRGYHEFENRESPTCSALKALDIRHAQLIQLHFAMVEPESSLYEHANALPDGRRFIIWR